MIEEEWNDGAWRKPTLDLLRGTTEGSMDLDDPALPYEESSDRFYVDAMHDG
jgi:hypothetical protein